LQRRRCLDGGVGHDDPVKMGVGGVYELDPSIDLVQVQELARE
jgi:hypothetical protein